MAHQIAQKPQEVEKYGPYGSQLPENYSFQLKDGEQFSEVIIRHGDIINAIGFVVKMPCGRTYPTPMFGGNGGVESRLDLNCGEKITKISGTYGNYKTQCNDDLCVIASLNIHTNQCPNGYGPFGKGNVECPKQFSSPCAPGAVVGFFGRSNNYLESIGIFVNKARC